MVGDTSRNPNTTDGSGSLADSARCATACQLVAAVGLTWFFAHGGQVGERSLDLPPDPAERDPEDALATLQQVDDLVGRGAGVHARAVAHQRDLGQVARAVLAQVRD